MVFGKCRCRLLRSLISSKLNQERRPWKTVVRAGKIEELLRPRSYPVEQWCAWHKNNIFVANYFVLRRAARHELFWANAPQCGTWAASVPGTIVLLHHGRLSPLASYALGPCTGVGGGACVIEHYYQLSPFLYKVKVYCYT